MCVSENEFSSNLHIFLLLTLTGVRYAKIIRGFLLLEPVSVMIMSHPLQFFIHCNPTIQSLNTVSLKIIIKTMQLTMKTLIV
jgi:hypothetical protein